LFGETESTCPPPASALCQPHSAADISRARKGEAGDNAPETSQDGQQGASAAEPVSQVKKGKRGRQKGAESVAVPPAVVAYREIFQRYPKKATYPLIAEAVGEQLEIWKDILTQWLLSGYNPNNLAGMLEAFRDGGLRRRTQEESRQRYRPGETPFKKGEKDEQMAAVRRLAAENERRKREAAGRSNTSEQAES
jgi:hypothetical protein